MENEKAKRARRRRETWRVAVRRFKAHAAVDHPRQETGPIRCGCNGEVGRYRKRSLGCGNARCLLCHFGKIFYISRSEKLANIRTQDAMEDLREDLRADPGYP